MTTSRRPRGRFLAVAAIVVALVAAPTAAAAYWVVNATTSATAASAAFAIAGPQPTTVTLGGSKDNLGGFSGSRQTSTTVKNTGEVAWESLDIELPTARAFASPAAVNAAVAAVGAGAACPTAASAYMPVPATGSINLATTAARLAPGASATVCLQFDYSRFSMLNRGESSAMKLIVTPRLHNWTAKSTPAEVTITAPQAGVAKCRGGSGWFGSATISFQAPIDGIYRLTVDGTDKSRPKAVGAGEATFDIDAEWFISWDKATALIQRETKSGLVDVADSKISRNLFGAVTCA